MLLEIFLELISGISGMSLETKLGFIRSRGQLFNLEEHPSEKIQMELTLLNPSLHKGQSLQKQRLKMSMIPRKGSWIQRTILNFGDSILVLSKITLKIIFFNKNYGISNSNKNLSTW